MKKEIEKNDLGDLVIGRAKSNEAASSQIDTLAKDFKGCGEEKRRIEFSNERGGEIIPARKEEGAPFGERKMEIPRKEERSRIKRREKAVPWEIEMDSGGKSPQANMLKSSL